MSESMHPENFVNPYLKNQCGEFHSILVTDVFGFIDVLIRLWGQKVKGQGLSRQRDNCRRKPLEFHLVNSLMLLIMLVCSVRCYCAVCCYALQNCQ